MQTLSKAPKLQNYFKKRLGSDGFNINAIDLCEQYGLLCMGDKSGLVYLIYLPKNRLVKKISFPKEIVAIKYIHHEKALFIASGSTLFKFSLRKQKVTSTKALNFWPRAFEYVDNHEVLAVVGDSFSILFFSMELKYSFCINYSNPSRMIGSVVYLPNHCILVIGLDDGSLVACDMKTARILCHDIKQKSLPQYLKYIKQEDMLISGGREGKIYMRKFDRYEGFKTIECLWMKKKEILNMIVLKDGKHVVCIHEDFDNVSIIRIKDWQLIKNIPLFSNKTGGTNLFSLEQGNSIVATEKGEGYYYIMKQK